MIIIDPTKKSHVDAESKKHLLAEAMPRRDTLLMHLSRFYTKATEEVTAAEIALAAAVGQTAIDAAQLVLTATEGKKQAIQAAINSLESIFNDQRVIDAIDGAVAYAVKVVYLEIFSALYQASPSTYLALKALDPL